MGSDHNLKTWVSDKLMSLVGFSQPTVVQYVIGLSKQAVSAADVQTKLEEFGCSSSTETRTFAQELFARVPRKAAGLNGIAHVEQERRQVKRRTSKDIDDEEAIRRSNALEKDDIEYLRYSNNSKVEEYVIHLSLTNADSFNLLKEE
ncbi:hypothetical protein CICLE_v10024265mg, partial [Citrus x clementina]